MSFRYVLCGDLGQVNDFSSAIILEEKLEVLERGDINTVNLKLAQRKRIKAVSLYHVRHAERLPLGMTYPDQVDRYAQLLNHPELSGETVFLLDQTGVGRPVVDMARDRGLAPIGVTLTGGRLVSVTDDGYHVPKRDVIMEALKLFQSQRLLIAEELKFAKTLAEELVNFRLKITKTGRDRYEAWREEDHDDLVLALAIACWFVSATGGAEQRILDLTPRRRHDWDPLAWGDEDEELPFQTMQFPTR